MKKLFILSLLLACVGIGIAQDIIITQEGEEIKAVVTEVKDNDVDYQIFKSKDNRIYTIKKSDIFVIKYQNGEKETFVINQKTEEKKANVNNPAYPYPYPPVTKKYQLGDFFNEGGVKGIVFYVEDEGTHGLIVSLKEVGSHIFNSFKTDYAWYFRMSEIFRNEDTRTCFYLHADNKSDGWVNMSVILRCVAQTELKLEEFGAFYWCRTLGEGWYLPSIEELWKLYFCYNSKSDFNTILKKAGGKGIVRDIYMSSTEANERLVYGLNFKKAGAEEKKLGKTECYPGMKRAVHKF